MPWIQTGRWQLHILFWVISGEFDSSLGVQPRALLNLPVLFTSISFPFKDICDTHCQNRSMSQQHAGKLSATPVIQGAFISEAHVRMPGPRGHPLGPGRTCSQLGLRDSVFKIIVLEAMQRGEPAVPTKIEMEVELGVSCLLKLYNSSSLYNTSYSLFSTNKVSTMPICLLWKDRNQQRMRILTNNVEIQWQSTILFWETNQGNSRAIANINSRIYLLDPFGVSYHQPCKGQFVLY